MAQSNRTAHQVRLGKGGAQAAIGAAVNAHKAGRGLKVHNSAGYDAAHGPLSEKAEAFFSEDLEEPDDLAFEGAKVSRDPDTGRFIRAPTPEDSGITQEGFDIKGGGSADQQRAVEAGFKRAARAKGWRVD